MCVNDQGEVTPISTTVTAATALGQLYTKEGVESLRILPYTIAKSTVKARKSAQSTVKTLKISAVNGQAAQKSGQSFDLPLNDRILQGVTLP